MANSQNGWTAFTEYGAAGLVSNPVVPGVGVKVLGGLRSGDVATVLLWIAQQWHKRVRPLVQDEGIWGYNYRPVRGGSSLSNHSSGTAIDLSSAVFPMGSRNMSAAQRAAARAIAAEAGVVRWGGEWSGSGVDEMHYEINGSAAAVAAAAQRLGKAVAPTPEKPADKPEPTPIPTPAPTPRKRVPDMYLVRCKTRSGKTLHGTVQNGRVQAIDETAMLGGLVAYFPLIEVSAAWWDQNRDLGLNTIKAD